MGLKAKRLIISEGEWGGHMRACQASGMTGAAYALAHGIKAKSFYNARRRIGMRVGQEAGSQLAFRRVEVIGDSGAECAYRIRFRSGVVVEVVGGGPDRLGGVLQVLGAYL